MFCQQTKSQFAGVVLVWQEKVDQKPRRVRINFAHDDDGSNVGTTPATAAALASKVVDNSLPGMDAPSLSEAAEINGTAGINKSSTSDSDEDDAPAQDRPEYTVSVVCPSRPCWC